MDLPQESELSWYLTSTVKNSILKKIYTFSIAFLEVTIGETKGIFFFFFCKRRKLFFSFTL